MQYLFLLLLVFLSIVVSACTTWPKGLRTTGGGSFYKTYWYDNPNFKGKHGSLGINDYYKDIEGALGNRLIPKYCSIIDGKEIPIEEVWFVKNFKQHSDNQSTNNVYYYYKNSEGEYQRDRNYSYNDKVAIVKTCQEDGFCLLYKRAEDGYWNKNWYIRRQDIYKDDNVLMLNRNRANIPPDDIGCPEVW